MLILTSNPKNKSSDNTNLSLFTTRAIQLIVLKYATNCLTYGFAAGSWDGSDGDESRKKVISRSELFVVVEWFEF